MPVRRLTSFFSLIAVLVIAAGLLAPFSVAFAQQSIGDVVGTDPSTGQVVTGRDGEEGQTGIASTIIGWVLRPFTWAFQAIGGLFVTLSGWFLDKAIEFSIGSQNAPNLNDFQGIQNGWIVMRDFANLFFIFVILYIAIMTILQLGSHNTKQMLVRVIIVALLINFSAFFTKVVIDVGNVIAVGFYNRIMDSPAPDDVDNICSTGGVNRVCGIGDRMKSALAINLMTAGRDGLSSLQISVTYFLTGLLFFMAGIVFIKGVFFFIARTIAFAFLIMFSPIAFLSYAIPNSTFSGFMTRWWSKLFGYTLLAPTYMIVMYLVLQLIQAPGFRPQINSGFDLLLNYILVLGLLWAGSNIAFSFADSAGQAFGRIGGNVSRFAAGAGVGAVTAGSAVFFRNTAGLVGQRLGERKELTDKIAKGGFTGKFAQLRKDVYDKAATSSWDLSRTKAGSNAIGSMGAQVPGFMQAAKGGIRETGSLSHQLLRKGKVSKEQQEEYVKRAKELYPSDPEKQEEYLRNWMGRAQTKEAGETGMMEYENVYDSSKVKAVKEARAEINRKSKEKEAEDNAKEMIASLDELPNKLKEQETLLADATAKGDTAMEAFYKSEIDTINKTMEKTRTGLAEIITRLRPSSVASFDEKILKSKSFAGAVDRKTLHEVHKSYMDGKYQDQELLSTISANVFESGNDKAKEYLASSEGKKNLFNYTVPAAYASSFRPKKLRAKETLKAKIERNIAGWESELASLDTSASDYISAKAEYERNIRTARVRVDDLDADIAGLKEEHDISDTTA